MSRVATLFAPLLFSLATAAQLPTAITTDPPSDPSHPATMQAFQLPSHGSMLNALMYEASGPGPHATVVLLHGFPGNEKNLDLAQVIRRDGWNVLYFDYRGSWGTPGSFSFQHAVEDVQSALAYLRDPAAAARLRVDPDRLALVGHSMGGMLALYVAAHDEKVVAVGGISASIMADRGLLPAGASPEAQQQVLTALSKFLAAQGMAPLADCTPEGLAAELMKHPEWALVNDAPGLKNKPLLLLTANDGNADVEEKLASAVSVEGNNRVRIVHFATDHSYSDKRIAVAMEVLRTLDALPAK